MDPQTIFLPAKPRVARGRRPAGPAGTPPVGAPVLVSAAYDPAGPTLTLAFDRAVDVAGFNGYAVAVDDGPGNVSYDGSLGATLHGPATVVVSLMDVGPGGGAGVTMTTGGPTGIVAVDGGLPWAGASGVPLPFPSWRLAADGRG